jgi:hypothetical protein
MSTLSISIVPSLGSTILKSAWIKVDFPLPVRPTMPTFFLAGIVHDMFLKTDGRCSAYRTCRRKEQCIGVNKTLRFPSEKQKTLPLSLQRKHS